MKSGSDQSESWRQLAEDNGAEAARRGSEVVRLRAALREAIKLARDFNRGAMTWKEYDRKLAALARLALDEGDQ